MLDIPEYAKCEALSVTLSRLFKKAGVKPHRCRRMAQYTLRFTEEGQAAQDARVCGQHYKMFKNHPEKMRRAP